MSAPVRFKGGSSVRTATDVGSGVAEGVSVSVVDVSVADVSVVDTLGEVTESVETGIVVAEVVVMPASVDTV